MDYTETLKCSATFHNNIWKEWKPDCYYLESGPSKHNYKIFYKNKKTGEYWWRYFKDEKSVMKTYEKELARNSDFPILKNEATLNNKPDTE